MSTGTLQTTFDGAQQRKRGELGRYSQILWDIGQEGEIKDTEAQLQEAYRRAAEEGVLRGETE